LSRSADEIITATPENRMVVYPYTKYMISIMDVDMAAALLVASHEAADALGVPPERRVASPTFTLVNEHTGRCPLYHVDLYRIEDPDELEEIGMREYLGGRGVTVIEWAERLGRLAPRERLEVAITSTGPESRTFVARAVGARASSVLEGWSI